MAKKRISLSDQLRRVVDDCGVTRYRIAQDTGIDASTLCRFMSGERGLPMNTVDVLADYLDINIIVAD